MRQHESHLHVRCQRARVRAGEQLRVGAQLTTRPREGVASSAASGRSSSARQLAHTPSSGASVALELVFPRFVVVALVLVLVFFVVDVAVVLGVERRRARIDDVQDPLATRRADDHVLGGGGERVEHVVEDRRARIASECDVERATCDIRGLGIAHLESAARWVLAEREELAAGVAELDEHDRRPGREHVLERDREAVRQHRVGIGRAVELEHRDGPPQPPQIGDPHRQLRDAHPCRELAQHRHVDRLAYDHERIRRGGRVVVVVLDGRPPAICHDIRRLLVGFAWIRDHHALERPPLLAQRFGRHRRAEQPELAQRGQLDTVERLDATCIDEHESAQRGRAHALPHELGGVVFRRVDPRRFECRTAREQHLELELRRRVRELDDQMSPRPPPAGETLAPFEPALAVDRERHRIDKAQRGLGKRREALGLVDPELGDEAVSPDHLGLVIRNERGGVAREVAALRVEQAQGRLPRSLQHHRDQLAARLALRLQ